MCVKNSIYKTSTSFQSKKGVKMGWTWTRKPCFRSLSLAFISLCLFLIFHIHIQGAQGVMCYQCKPRDSACNTVNSSNLFRVVTLTPTSSTTTTPTTPTTSADPNAPSTTPAPRVPEPDLVGTPRANCSEINVNRCMIQTQRNDVYRGCENQTLLPGVNATKTYPNSCVELFKNSTDSKYSEVCFCEGDLCNNNTVNKFPERKRPCDEDDSCDDIGSFTSLPSTFLIILGLLFSMPFLDKCHYNSVQ